MYNESHTQFLSEVLDTLYCSVTLNKSPWVSSVFKSPLHWGVHKISWQTQWSAAEPRLQPPGQTNACECVHTHTHTWKREHEKKVRINVDLTTEKDVIVGLWAKSWNIYFHLWEICRSFFFFWGGIWVSKGHFISYRKYSDWVESQSSEDIHIVIAVS